MLLSKHFGPTVVIAVHPEPKGLNSKNKNAHFVAHVADGRRIGIKKPSLVPASMLCERVLHELAVQVSAPNACRFATTTLGASFPTEMQGDIFLIERMVGQVRDVQPLSAPAPDPNVVLDARAHAESFLEQQGEWMTFTQAFSVRDRHGENVLWDLHDHRLLHVDFEMAFRAMFKDRIGTQNVEWLKLAGFSVADWRATQPDARRTALERGVESMHTKLQQNMANIEAKLRAEGIANGEIGSTLLWIRLAKERKIAYWRDALSP